MVPFVDVEWCLVRLWVSSGEVWDVTGDLFHDGEKVDDPSATR
jgi:hypothetical protein